MPKRSREAVAPLYLLLCLLLGGSAQGMWGNMLLQLIGIAIIAWAAAERSDEALAPPARLLLILAGLALLVVSLQLVPLPASLWPSLGGRGAIAAGYKLLGLPVPAFPVSLAPHNSLGSLLALIPPLAMILAIVRLKAYHPSWLAWALLAGTIAGVLLGAMQVGGPNSGSSPWYLYADTNFGTAVGFFANANHMADLLVINLPFLAAIPAAGRGAKIQRLSVVAPVAGAGLVILIGIFINGSLAGYGLAFPVLFMSLLIVVRRRSALRGPVAALAALLLVVAVGFIARTSVGSTVNWNKEAATSAESRQVMLATTTRAIEDFMPLGSGLGSFRQVYNLYEDPGQVTRTYVVHAHNDYAELALETGAAGVVLMVLFLAWWARAAWSAWRSAEAGPFGRAGSIASAAILAHSVVDFPLRTAAISACFGMCLALLADRRGAPRQGVPDLRPTRHFVFQEKSAPVSAAKARTG